MKIIAIIISLLCISFSFANTVDSITITVVYNNVPYDKNLTTDWGLAVVVQGLEDTILFDTGGDGAILLSNMEKLNIDRQSIETIVLSHIHMDHIGGLDAFLEKNDKVTVYMPASFPDNLVASIEGTAQAAGLVDAPQKICEQVWSTGQLGTSMKEQSLIINAEKGLIIVTGCAHPGIVHIVKSAKEYMKKDIYLVIGGFHLMAYQDDQVRDIIDDLKALGVVKIAPSHCTGGRPIELFQEAWGEDFIDLGCGAHVHILNSEE